MRKQLSTLEVIRLPFCISKKELKHPFALNVISFVLVMGFLVALYYMIPVLSKVYSLLILSLLLYLVMVFTFYLFYEHDHK